MARRAKATATLLEQVNEAAPQRNKSSDGWIGDAAHAASKSDHNPNSAGVVQAQDITHDPRGGFDSYKFAEHLRTHPDKRIKYVISNRKIFAGNGGPQPWVWRKYSGKNPHDAHVHVSVEDSSKSYDDSSPWEIGFTVGLPDPTAPEITLPVLRVGSKGYYVSMLQTLLGMTGKDVDGIFGQGTKSSLQQFQRDHKLDVDGACGVYSWRELLRPWAKEVGLLPTDPKAKLTEMALVAQKTGSTATVEELLAAFLVILEDILPPGFVLKPGEPGEPTPPRELPKFVSTGKCSWFGGPDDKGVKPNEGLAFITKVEQAPQLFLPKQPPGTTGLARRLDPQAFYIACRWNYKKTSRDMLLDKEALVRAPSTGRELMAFPADWGPNEKTGRVADLSPGLMEALGIDTDDEVEVIFPYEESP